MNTVIVCYSLEGHTRKVCQRVAEKLGATLVSLRCVKPYPTSGAAKYLRASKDTLTGARPALEPIASTQLGACDLLILAAPCWAGKPAAPLNTFLAEHDLSGKRRAAIITCKAEGATEKYGKAIRSLCRLNTADPVLALSEGQIADDAALASAVDAFCARCRD